MRAMRSTVVCDDTITSHALIWHRDAILHVKTEIFENEKTLNGISGLNVFFI